MSNTLTINLGVRYDVDPEGLDPPVGDATSRSSSTTGVTAGNFGYQPGVRDYNNVAPRVGFAYNVGGNNDLVIRGGTGLYYNFPVSNVTYRQQFYNNAMAAVFLPTGTNFLYDPLGGATPEQYLSGAVPTPPQETTIISPDYRDPVRLAELDRLPEAVGIADGVRRGLHQSRRAQHGAQP